MKLGLEIADLGLDQPRTAGRAKKQVNVEVVRELTVVDLAERATEKGTKAPPLRRLSERHRFLARLIASGEKPSVAAIAAGYTASSVSILLTDTAFQELVRSYVNKIDDKFINNHERIAALGSDIIDEISFRLETKPDEIPTGMLKELATFAMDRSGHGPATQTNTTLNVNVDVAGRLSRARKRMQTIEAQAKDITDE